MNINNLTKSQKKICRQLIDMALQRQCTQFIDELSKELTRINGNGKTSLENYYHLYKQMNSFDRLIAETYDDISGSMYFLTIVSLFMRGILTDDDVSILDDDLLNELKICLKSC